MRVSMHTLCLYSLICIPGAGGEGFRKAHHHQLSPRANPDCPHYLDYPPSSVLCSPEQEGAMVGRHTLNYCLLGISLMFGSGTGNLTVKIW